MTLAETAIALFAGFNTLRIFAYFPQIVRIGRDRSGAAAISCWTWGLFGASHLSTVVYATAVMGDLIVALIFVLNTLCCGAIIGITLYKRAKFATASAPPMEHGAAAQATSR